MKIFCGHFLPYVVLKRHNVTDLLIMRVLLWPKKIYGNATERHPPPQGRSVKVFDHFDADYDYLAGIDDWIDRASGSL